MSPNRIRRIARNANPCRGRAPADWQPATRQSTTLHRVTNRDLELSHQSEDRRRFLKSHGTLWDQLAGAYIDHRLPAPSRLGKRTDWLAMTMEFECVVALARDVTICRFGKPWADYGPPLGLLSCTHRVTWSLNLLDAANESLKQQPE